MIPTVTPSLLWTSPLWSPAPGLVPRGAGFRVRADDGAWTITVWQQRPTAGCPTALAHVHIVSERDAGRLSIESLGFVAADGRPATDVRVVFEEARATPARLAVAASPAFAALAVAASPAFARLDLRLRLAMAMVMPRLARLGRTSATCAAAFAKLAALPLRVGARDRGEGPRGVAGTTTIEASWRGGGLVRLDIAEPGASHELTA